MFDDEIAEATGPDEELSLDADDVTVHESNYSFDNHVFNTEVQIKLSNEGSSGYHVFCHYSLILEHTEEKVEGTAEGTVDSGSTAILKDSFGLKESKKQLISVVKVNEIIVKPTALFNQGREDRRVIKNEE